MPAAPTGSRPPIIIGGRRGFDNHGYRGSKTSFRQPPFGTRFFSFQHHREAAAIVLDHPSSLTHTPRLDWRLIRNISLDLSRSRGRISPASAASREPHQQKASDRGPSALITSHNSFSFRKMLTNANESALPDNN